VGLLLSGSSGRILAVQSKEGTFMARWDPKADWFLGPKPKWTLSDQNLSEDEEHRRFQVWRERVLEQIKEADKWKFAGSA
jgi:hypothetical protein